MQDIIPTVDNWLKDDKTIALATVVETWGSSPRQVGAKMAVTDQMAMVGSVSGGCVETAVVEEALESLKDGQPRLLHFGVGDDTAWQVGLACGGKITVYVEPLDKAWWRTATDLVRDYQPITTLTLLDGPTKGQKLLVDQEQHVRYDSGGMINGQRDALLKAAVVSAGSKASGRKEVNAPDATLDVFRDVFTPQPRLIMVGGAHVSMALQSFAQQLGFRVALIDPRKVFATPERFPNVETILHSYPDKALPQLGLDSQTYIAILTHDPKIDDPALRVALSSNVPYIGVLSSRRTHEQRIERLTKAGVDPQLMKRIRTPIGIDIGAKTPEEIALCIIAEIVAVKNGVLKD